MTLADDQRIDPAETDTVRRHFWDHGWVTVPGVYERAEIEAVARLAGEISSAELAAHPEPSYTVDASGDGRLAPRKIDWPFLKHDLFRRFVLDPRLRSLIEALLGPDPCLLRDQLFMKPPSFGSPKPYHQENAPLQIQPADSFVVAWVALDDVDEDNGCLRYIDGSHRAPFPHAPVPGRPFDIAAEEGSYNPTDEVAVPLAAGGVIIHHSQTLHASHANRSGRWRRAYSSHWVTATVTSSTGALDHAYSRRIGTRPLAFTCD
jgi:phytanoyl-CoA hydroxylase